jgi:glucose 1-dehydrogenase
MRALVSGGSSGIGAATCVRLAEAALARGEQPQIAVCGHRVTTTQEQVVRSIQSLGGTAIALVGDLSDPDVPGQLVGAAVAEFGGRDGLVANAGIANPGAMCDLSVEDWDHMFGQPPRCVASRRSKLPAFEAESRFSLFRFLDVWSATACRIRCLQPSKAALTMLAQTLALVTVIRVNVVSPGMTHTRMTTKMYADPQIKKASEGIIPLSRIGDPHRYRECD